MHARSGYIPPPPPLLRDAELCVLLHAGGVSALMHACSGSPPELQIALLTVLRQLVVQPAGPEAFLVARAVPVLAMLQHSLVAEVRILATKILERVSASSSTAEDVIAQEQLVQVCCMIFCVYVSHASNSSNPKSSHAIF